MARQKGAVHVVTTKREYKGKTYVAHLLRRSYREGGKVCNETVGNLSHLPDHIVDLIRKSLRGERLVGASESFDVVGSPQHGNVAAVLAMMRGLGMSDLLSSRPCRERDLAMAMIAARVLNPMSKLATTRWWHNTTLPKQLGVEDASEDDLYAAMDWLLQRQPTIEKKLAARHLPKGGMVLYDISSSYFEGTKCPLAALGHSRDGKKGTLQVNYGLVTDAHGCPVSITAFAGNTGDSTTVLAQATKIRERFEVESMVLVGDRGMITDKQIAAIRDLPGMDWVTALRSPAIRDLVERKAIQLGLFDERNLFEITDERFPGERLVACRNPDLAERRRLKRVSLLEATKQKLEKVQAAVAAGRLRGKDKIGLRVGKLVDAHKVAKHFVLAIEDGSFAFSIDESRVAAEAALDGIYVIRTSVAAEDLSTDGVVLAYKRLSAVERAFRSIKTIDLHVRPIRHWAEGRVRSHIFLCMLAYYVQYHMQEAWRELLYADEAAWTITRSDPVAKAPRSASAKRKDATKKTSAGWPAHSFRTLLEDLASIVRNRCRRKGAAEGEPEFDVETQGSPLQIRALELIEGMAL